MLLCLPHIDRDNVLGLGEGLLRMGLCPSDETLDQVEEAARTLYRLREGYTLFRTGWRVDHASPTYRMLVKQTLQGFEACIEYESAQGDLYTVQRFSERQQAIDFAVAY
jgi:hypothetical protein